jgi:acetyl esterase/lipase
MSGSKVLLDDARRAARRLAAGDVPTEMRIRPGQMHVFALCAPLMPEATRPLRQIGAYIREATRETAQHPTIARLADLRDYRSVPMITTC